MIPFSPGLAPVLVFYLGHIGSQSDDHLDLLDKSTSCSYYEQHTELQSDITVSWILKLVKVKCFGFQVSRTQRISDKIPVHFSKELIRRN